MLGARLLLFGEFRRETPWQHNPRPSPLLGNRRGQTLRLIFMKTLISLLALTLLVSACGKEQPPGGDPFGVTTWQLASGAVDGTALVLVDDRFVTFRVDNGQIGGVAACNHYGGDITITNGVVTISAMFMTEMACPDDGLMELEAGYLAALARVNAVALEGDELVLTGEGVELRFTAQPKVPDAALMGTTWTLDTIIEGDVASTPSSPASLTFDEDGAVTGSTGCNSLFGTYSAMYGFTSSTRPVGSPPIRGSIPGSEARAGRPREVESSRRP